MDESAYTVSRGKYQQRSIDGRDRQIGREHRPRPDDHSNAWTLLSPLTQGIVGTGEEWDLPISQRRDKR